MFDKLLEFLEWLNSGEYNVDVGPIELAYYPPIVSEPIYGEHKPGDLLPPIVGYREIPREDWERESRLASLTYQPELLLYKFFGVDPKKLDDERQALLEEQRRVNDCDDA